MTEILPLVELPIIDHSIIKVIGVGGGGGNAVNHMYNQGFRDVAFVVCNTDNQALQHSPVPLKIQLGEGLGAGGKPEVAKRAAEESIENIKGVLQNNTKMIFITAGMGGGTGTGASPVVARVAQELGILTVGIVTIPFAFEGNKKIEQALEGVIALSKHVDALLVINNERLHEIFADLDLTNAFARADDVLTNAARSIAEIITVPGYINTDFADVHTILHKGNVAIMNTGYAAGEDRITKAIADALNSPLLNTTDVKGASKVLLNLYCSKEHQIKMEEVKQINAFMAEVGDDIEVIWGATFDESLGEQVKITLIATGYQVSDIPGMPAGAVQTKVANTSRIVTVGLDDDVEAIISSQKTQVEEPVEEESIVEKTKAAYYNQGNAQQQPYVKPVVENEEKPVLTEASEAIKTIDLDDLENLSDDTIIEQAENIPAWKRRLGFK